MEFYLQIYYFPNTNYQKAEESLRGRQGQRRDLQTSDIQPGAEKGEASLAEILDTEVGGKRTKREGMWGGRRGYEMQLLRSSDGA